MLWDYNIVIEIAYKCKVEHVLICEIHVNMWWWIVMVWDVKIVDMEFGCECVVKTRCDITCV